MLSRIYSAGLFGIDGFPVTVEVDAQNRLDYFEVVGLPDAAVKEAKERVRTACENTGYPFPECSLLINLAPADRRKEGSGFDVAILTGILSAVGVIRSTVRLNDKCFVGELSLSGELRPVRGVLSMCVAARDAGLTEFYTSMENAPEAAAVEGISVYGVPSMRVLLDHLNGRRVLAPLPRSAPRPPRPIPTAWIFPTSRGKPRLSAPWRSPRRADTTFCSSALPARENPCWPSGFPPFSLP